MMRRLGIALEVAAALAFDPVLWMLAFALVLGPLCVCLRRLFTGE